MVRDPTACVWRAALLRFAVMQRADGRSLGAFAIAGAIVLSALILAPDAVSSTVNYRACIEPKTGAVRLIGLAGLPSTCAEGTREIRLAERGRRGPRGFSGSDGTDGRDSAELVVSGAGVSDVAAPAGEIAMLSDQISVAAVVTTPDSFTWTIEAGDWDADRTKWSTSVTVAPDTALGSSSVRALVLTGVAHVPDVADFEAAFDVVSCEWFGYVDPDEAMNGREVFSHSQYNSQAGFSLLAADVPVHTMVFITPETTTVTLTFDVDCYGEGGSGSVSATDASLIGGPLVVDGITARVLAFGTPGG